MDSEFAACVGKLPYLGFVLGIILLGIGTVILIAKGAMWYSEIVQSYQWFISWGERRRLKQEFKRTPEEREKRWARENRRDDFVCKWFGWLGFIGKGIDIFITVWIKNFFLYGFIKIWRIWAMIGSFIAGSWIIWSFYKAAMCYFTYYN